VINMIEMPDGASMKNEILCTIPPSPGYCTLKELGEDFGVSISFVGDLIKPVTGVRVFNGPTGEGRRATIELPEGRPLYKRLMTYWSKVHS